MNIVFIDLETTGFSRENNEIIEIAAIQVDEQLNQISKFHEYIKPYNPINHTISELTGITNNMVSMCEHSPIILQKFIIWLEERNIDCLIGHNIQSFDLQFLIAQTDKINLDNDILKNAIIIDTLKMSRELKKKKKLFINDCKQPTLANYFGINYEAHSAINDVEALIKIYNFLCKI